jgi:hypothetical protein
VAATENKAYFWHFSVEGQMTLKISEIDAENKLFLVACPLFIVASDHPK